MPIASKVMRRGVASIVALALAALTFSGSPASAGDSDASQVSVNERVASLVDIPNPEDVSACTLTTEVELPFTPTEGGSTIEYALSVPSTWIDADFIWSIDGSSWTTTPLHIDVVDVDSVAIPTVATPAIAYYIVGRAPDGCYTTTRTTADIAETTEGGDWPSDEVMGSVADLAISARRLASELGTDYLSFDSLMGLCDHWHLTAAHGPCSEIANVGDAATEGITANEVLGRLPDSLPALIAVDDVVARNMAGETCHTVTLRPSNTSAVAVLGPQSRDGDRVDGVTDITYDYDPTISELTVHQQTRVAHGGWESFSAEYMSGLAFGFNSSDGGDILVNISTVVTPAKTEAYAAAGPVIWTPNPFTTPPSFGGVGDSAVGIYEEFSSIQQTGPDTVALGRSLHSEVRTNATANRQNNGFFPTWSDNTTPSYASKDWGNFTLKSGEFYYGRANLHATTFGEGGFNAQGVGRADANDPGDRLRIRFQELTITFFDYVIPCADFK